MGLLAFFRRKKEVKETVESVSRIQFEKLEDADDTYLTKLATNMINGAPLIINLEDIDIDGANKVIAFLSGVVYAIEGEIYSIKDKVFLFGNSQVYNDGSIKKLIEELI